MTLPYNINFGSEAPLNPDPNNFRTNGFCSEKREVILSEESDNCLFCSCFVNPIVRLQLFGKILYRGLRIFA